MMPVTPRPSRMKIILSVLLLMTFVLAVTESVLLKHAREAVCGEATAFANHREPRLVDFLSADAGLQRLDEDSGETSSEPSRGTSRVVGGQKSPDGAWPWMVSLQLLHPGLGFVAHLCGGVLVHPYWVVTAAHCIRNERYELALAALWSAEFTGRRRVAVEEILVHEKYTGFNNDIALVRLVKPAAGAVPLCLPRPGQSFLGVRCVASGWSGRPAGHSGGAGHKLQALPERLLERRKSPGTLARTAQRRHGLLQWLQWQEPERRQGAGPPGPRAHTALTVVASSDCRSLYSDRYNLTLGPGHLCAGRGRLAAGTCLGDSGGPLQCNMEDGRWYLAGVTSFGSGCGRPGFPDVFSRIAYYLPWVHKKINHYRLK